MAINPQQRQGYPSNANAQQGSKLRRPPNAGGSRRLPAKPAVSAPQKKKRKLWKYILPGLTAGGSFGLAVSNIFS